MDDSDAIFKLRSDESLIQSHSYVLNEYYYLFLEEKSSSFAKSIANSSLDF